MISVDLGTAANIAQVASVAPLMATPVVLLRRHNCAAPRCWRLGRHPTADGLHSLCSKHHPDVPRYGMSLAEIRARHRAAEEEK